MRLVVAAVAAVVGLSLALPASADEVLEAAKKEKARREAAARKKGKSTEKSTTPTVISNRNLKAAAGEGPSRLSQVSGEGAPPAAGAGSAAQQAAAAAKKEGAPAEGQKQDEAYWRGRMAEANGALEKARGELAELNARVNDLRREASTIQDPQIRYRKSQDLLQAEGDTPKAVARVAEAEKAVSAMREEARRAGASPGWLR